MLPIIKIAIVLLIILVIVLRKINLVYALIAGILATAYLFSSIPQLPADFMATISDQTVWFLMLAFYFVFYFGGLLTESGILNKMLAALEKIIKDIRFVIISLPFLIGLVPTPSGAILSAPFVDEVGDKAKLSRERKHIINYWFRHITEYINPIYPGPLLAVALVGITFKTLMIVNLPVMLFVFLVGFILFVRNTKSLKKMEEKPTKKDMLLVINGLWPIFLAISIPIIFNLDLWISLLITIVLSAFVYKVKSKTLVKLIKTSFKPDIIIMVFLVMLFKQVLEQSKAIGLVSANLLQYGFPEIAIVIIIPMIVGALTGGTMSYVGISFPLIMSFLKPSLVNLGFFMLAYVSGYIGVLVSPTHLCFAVTQEYFKAPYGKLYKLLVPALLLVMAFTVILVLIGWPFQLV